MSRQDLQKSLGLKDAEHFRKAYLLPALETGWIEMTIPYKPRGFLAASSNRTAGRGVAEETNVRGMNGESLPDLARCHMSTAPENLRRLLVENRLHPPPSEQRPPHLSLPCGTMGR